MQRRAVVVGAGVVGLTSAQALAGAGWDVQVVAERAPADTVSAVAGASFKPNVVAASPLVARLLQTSRDALDRLWETGRAAGLHVSRGSHREVRLDPDADMSHLTLMRDVRWAQHDRWPVDVTYTTYLFDPVPALQALAEDLERRGVQVVTGTRVGSLEDLSEAAGGPELIVNCAGLGAGPLAGDGSLVPVKGQVVSVPRSSADVEIGSYSIGGFYLYRRAADLLLGGTTEWDASPGNDPGTVERILAGHALLHPELSGVTASRPMWGMRPYRPGGLRLARGRPAGRSAVLHDYGHGGAGWILALGCAQEVARLAESLPAPS